MAPAHETNPERRYSLASRVLAGAVIGLALILWMLSTVKNARPEWGPYWMVRPLVMVPLAGALAGGCNFILFRFGVLIGIQNKWVAGVLSAIILLIGLWLGIIVGLDGTLWN